MEKREKHLWRKSADKQKVTLHLTCCLCAVYFSFYCFFYICFCLYYFYVFVFKRKSYFHPLLLVDRVTKQNFIVYLYNSKSSILIFNANCEAQTKEWSCVGLSASLHTQQVTRQRQTGVISQSILIKNTINAVYI